MTLTLSRFVRSLLVVGMAVLAGCSASGKFRNVGEPPQWKDTTELPVPDDGSVEPNTLRIVLQCPTAEGDEEFVGRLRESILAQCKQAGMGDVALLPKGTGKKAHYEIMVYEAGEDGKFDFNEEAGIWTGVGSGVATGIATESLGYGVAGAAGGAAVGGLIGGSKNEKYAFAGVCRQRTSVEAEKTATTNSDNKNKTAGGIKDDASGTTTASNSERVNFERATWNLKTRAYEFPFMFTITVEGGAMSNKSGRDAAAREAFLKQFPKFVTGGTAIGG